MMFRSSLYYSENCSADRVTPWPTSRGGRFQTVAGGGGWFPPGCAALRVAGLRIVWWSRAAVLMSPRCCEWESEAPVSPVCSLLGNRRGFTSYFQRREGPSSRVNRATKSIFRIDYPSSLKKPGTPESGRVHGLCAQGEEKCSVALEAFPFTRAFITFRITATPDLFSPARNSHLSSRQTDLSSCLLAPVSHT